MGWFKSVGNILSLGSSVMDYRAQQAQAKADQKAKINEQQDQLEQANEQVAQANKQAQKNYEAQIRQVNKNNAAITESINSLIQSFNYDMENLQQQRMTTFDSVVNDIMHTKQAGSRNLSAVQAALGESIGGGGRTGKLIERNAASQTVAALNTIHESVQKYSQSISEAERQAQLSTNQQTNALYQQYQEAPEAPEMATVHVTSHGTPMVNAPSALSTLVGLGSTYIAGQTNNFATQSLQHSALVGRTTARTTGSSYDFTYKPQFGSVGTKSPTTGAYDFSYKNPYSDAKNSTGSYFGYTL